MRSASEFPCVMDVYSVVFYMCFLLHTAYQCALYCDGVRSTGEFTCVMCVCVLG